MQPHGPTENNCIVTLNKELTQIDKSTKDWSLKRKIKKNTKSINKKTNEK